MKPVSDTKIEILMPQFAESVVTATISKWLKTPGDQVEEYEPLCEVITDKVTAELPSTADGILDEIRVPEGETVEVGTVICTLRSAGTAGVSAAGTGDDSPADALTAQAADFGLESSTDRSMRNRISPAVRRLADEYRLDLESIKGTGFGGRITRKDVLAFIEKGRQNRPARHSQAAPSQAAQQAPAEEERKKAATPRPKFSGSFDLITQAPAGAHDEERSETIIDVTPIRSTIAARMRQSVAEIPHAWTMIEVDVTNLVALRNKLKDEFMKREGINLTYLAFVLKAVVNAIKEYPIINSVWAVDKIIIKRDINISLAVGTEEAVYTPVIKKADQKNIAGLAREIDTLTKKARTGKLTVEDMQGGTITVNNTGTFGSILSQPIINYPQAVNLTFEAIVKRPVVINDMIAVRSIANMCLSLDHRIVDGFVCGRFLQKVKENIESYDMDTQLY